MATKYKLPALGENIETAQVIGVLVAPGDRIEKDQSVIEVETDKASLEVPAPASGRVTEVFVSEGDTIAVGKDFISIESEDGAEPRAEKAGKTAPAKAAEPARKSEKRAEPSGGRRRPARASRQADEDARAEEEPAAEPAERRPEPENDAERGSPASLGGARRGAFAAPSVRRFAREIGVDIDDVTGSGPGGRISIADVKEYSRSLRQDGAARGGRAREARRGPDFAPLEEPLERRPLSNVRRTIAERMTRSWTSVPHVTLHARADVTEVEEVRRRYAAKAERTGTRVSITAILLKVVASALRVHPLVNSSLDAEEGELVLKRAIHLGVAVDTERGLLVPVVRDADQKNILELAAEIAEIAERARSGKLKPDEMKGSGITLTNLGGMGISEFTPIINPPEVAVLGVGRAELVARIAEGEVVGRSELPLSLSIDHRVLDGADGARFLQWIVRGLEDPLVLALEG